MSETPIENTDQHEFDSERDTQIAWSVFNIGVAETTWLADRVTIQIDRRQNEISYYSREDERKTNKI